ncbi:Rieske (2Fe-2S) domain-containing protein [Caballeronia arvi]|uniref:Rieske (2Fe-2S) domain-containing protein n=1 Tax=Caballeronia arvi TaxID=1777135 RepID=A0A158KKD5_9BURK|nr:Rieske 2Fe-2S domain-containing protein [Caballeronia arvi]SAL80861.1 Rieske (2Fe-2S) domain-containing protein [Caballeronia arvi]
MEASSSFVDEALLNRVPRWNRYLEAKLGFRNHWYPVLLSRDITEAQVVPTTVCGEEILLKRIKGQVKALRNRCLHRGVKFSEKVESYTEDTITCWYHGFTYKWDDGKLCDILASPDSKAIGRRKVKTYPVQEAKGLVFVFVGDDDAKVPPLSEDVPPTFLDEDLCIQTAIYEVDSNWRVGAENGFDGLHVYIHRTSELVENTKRSLPIGHLADSSKLDILETDGEPKGIYDLFAHHVSVWEGKVKGQTVVTGIKRESDKPTRTTAASIWLPCSLRVDNFPDQGINQYEWYVPITADKHLYVITLGKYAASDEERAAFEHEFWSRWKPVSLENFNAQDVTARIALQKFYRNDNAWLDEMLIEGDTPIIKWRELCHRHARGVQKPEHM